MYLFLDRRIFSHPGVHDLDTLMRAVCSCTSIRPPQQAPLSPPRRLGTLSLLTASPPAPAQAPENAAVTYLRAVASDGRSGVGETHRSAKQGGGVVRYRTARGFMDQASLSGAERLAWSERAGEATPASVPECHARAAQRPDLNIAVLEKRRREAVANVDPT